MVWQITGSVCSTCGYNFWILATEQCVANRCIHSSNHECGVQTSTGQWSFAFHGPTWGIGCMEQFATSSVQQQSASGCFQTEIENTSLKTMTNIIRRHCGVSVIWRLCVTLFTYLLTYIISIKNTNAVTVLDKIETWVSTAADRPVRCRGSAHAKYSVSHHMVIKPVRLLGLAAEYRSRRWVWSTVVRRPPDVYDTHPRTKFTPPEMISRSRDMVGAHQNLNASRDLTTPLSRMVCHPWASTSYH